MNTGVLGRRFSKASPIAVQTCAVALVSGERRRMRSRGRTRRGRTGRREMYLIRSGLCFPLVPRSLWKALDQEKDVKSDL